jgi:hypothetical protein
MTGSDLSTRNHNTQALACPDGWEVSKLRLNARMMVESDPHIEAWRPAQEPRSDWPGGTGTLIIIIESDWQSRSRWQGCQCDPDRQPKRPAASAASAAFGGSGGPGGRRCSAPGGLVQVARAAEPAAVE